MSSRRRKGNSAAARRRQQAQRQRTMLYIIVAAVVLLVIGALAYYFVDNGTDPDLGQQFEDLGNNHLSAEPDSYIWNSNPPTSGPHAPSIAPWGIKTESVPEWFQVHNLEDGGVIVHYNCPDGCPETVEELESIMRDIDDDFERMILQPYENMDSRIALTAWTRLLELDDVDEDQITAFIEAYRGVDHHR